MELLFDISLFGPWWMYIFAPFWDTVLYLIAYNRQEYVLLTEFELFISLWLKIIVSGMCFWTSIFTFNGARGHIRN